MVPLGTIASVQFYANGVSVGTDTTFPYSVSWTPTATGSYTLTAVATDNGGNQTTTTGLGSTIVASRPDEFRAFLEKEIQQWAQAVRISGAKIE